MFHLKIKCFTSKQCFPKQMFHLRPMFHLKSKCFTSVNVSPWNNWVTLFGLVSLHYIVHCQTIMGNLLWKFQIKQFLGSLFKNIFDLEVMVIWQWPNCVISWNLILVYLNFVIQSFIFYFNKLNISLEPLPGYLRRFHS